MKLYFSPEAISLAPHILMVELGLDVELVRVNLRTKETSDGSDFLSLNPNGYVPTLVLDEDHILTETAAMLLYLADLKPELQLAPLSGTWERAEMWDALSFISTELAALCTPLFMPEISDETKVQIRKKLLTRLEYLAFRSSGQQYYLSDQFTVIDAYLFCVLGWLPRFTIDILQWPVLAELMDRYYERPSVIKAQQIESDFAPV